MKVRIHYTRFHRSRSCSARVLSLTNRKPRCKPEAPTSQPGTGRSRNPSQPSNACSTGRLPPSCESEIRDSHSCLSAHRNTSDSWKLHHPHPGAHWRTKLLHAGLGARRPHTFPSFWPLQSPGSDSRFHPHIHTCDWCAHLSTKPRLARPRRFLTAELPT